MNNHALQVWVEAQETMKQYCQKTDSAEPELFSSVTGTCIGSWRLNWLIDELILGLEADAVSSVYLSSGVVFQPAHALLNPDSLPVTNRSL